MRDWMRFCSTLTSPVGRAGSKAHERLCKSLAPERARRGGGGICLLERLQQWGHRTQLHRKGRKRGHGADEAAQGEGGAFVAQVQLDLP